MHAIFEDGSHQFRVQVGDRITVDLRSLDDGEEIEFNKVLLVTGDGEPTIGTPVIEGAKVIGIVQKEIRGPKLIIQKFRRRKNMRRKNGHRQKHLSVVIKEIVASA